VGILNVTHPQQGHASMTWEPGTKSEAEVKAAFDELISQGMGAVAVDANGAETFTREFAPEARTITVKAPLVGG